MGTTISSESKTWFDCLPTEIIFIIFDYLSNNDIIYTFFYFNQRFNNLILQNQRYLNYLELPTKNFNIWKKCFSIIGSRIQSLIITSIDLSFPLKYFSNLKSIIISSPYDYPEDQLKLILESESFTHLKSFKIKQNKINPKQLNDRCLFSQHDVLRKVFTDKSLLEVFHYSMTISLKKFQLTSYKTNLDLYSLKLRLTDFLDIFTLIFICTEFTIFKCSLPILPEDIKRPLINTTSN